MSENWYALLAAIISPQYISSDIALEIVTGEKVAKKGRKRSKLKIDDEAIEDMIRLKKTHTYEEIGEMYGISLDTVYSRIKRYNKRMQL